MIRATIGILASQGGFDSDAQAFFDRVDTAGGTLSDTEKAAVNQLVLDMKADGIWSYMKAIYPMVGASAAACAQNLRSSSFTGSFSSGWTFASTGVKGNGTSTFMDTNLSSNTSLSLNDLSLSIYSRTDSNIGGDIGDKNLTGGFSGIFIRLSNTFYGYFGRFQEGHQHKYIFIKMVQHLEQIQKHQILHH